MCVYVVCVCVGGGVTVCHFAGFFLFSLRLLPKVFCMLPVNVIRMVIDLVRVLSRIHACAYANSSALQCIHSLLHSPVAHTMYTYMCTLFFAPRVVYL